jgi:hypothetical protein
LVALVAFAAEFAAEAWLPGVEWLVMLEIELAVTVTVVLEEVTELEG